MDRVGYVIITFFSNNSPFQIIIFMLTIRKEQFRVFEVIKPAIFIPIMIKRLAEKFPSLTQLIGQEGLTNIIEQGISKSKNYGIELAYETSVIIEMSVLFGHAFDTDPLLNWAGEILNNPSLGSREKIESLKSLSLEYLNHTIPEDEIYPVPQYNKILNKSYEDLVVEFKNASQPEFLDYLKKFWREKFNQVKPGKLDLLFEMYLPKAEEHAFISIETINYYFLLMYLLGHQFDTDPQFPWIKDLLNDPQFDEEFYKASSLHYTVQVMLRELLEAA